MESASLTKSKKELRPKENAFHISLCRLVPYYTGFPHVDTTLQSLKKLTTLSQNFTLLYTGFVLQLRQVYQNSTLPLY